MSNKNWFSKVIAFGVGSLALASTLTISYVRAEPSVPPSRPVAVQAVPSTESGDATTPVALRSELGSSIRIVPGPLKLSSCEEKQGDHCSTVGQTVPCLDDPKNPEGGIGHCVCSSNKTFDC